MKAELKSKKKIVILASILLIGFLYYMLTNQKGPSISTKEIIITDDIKNTPTPSVVIDNNENGLTLGTESKISNANRQSAKVIGVRDGDTIEVDLGSGNFETVRYIGIDTPESVDPRRAVECFGKEASNMNNTLVMNKKIQLEKDISETDKYGRLLRYVFVDNIFVNQYLVDEGFAHASSYPPDVKYQEDLNSAEEDARLNKKGLWSACSSTNENNNTRGDNNPDDKDCSDFKSQKDAQEYFNSKGGSSTYNADKLDGSDRDGVVCEGLL
jgi:micrococcal nuclease